jgi:3-hydroxyisobutyrate dehydrogenase
MGAQARVGFIGLGNMGAGIAAHIADAGFPLTLWARRPASIAPFADRPGVRVADSPAEVGARADVVGICVWADADVDEVVRGSRGVLAGMDAGGTIAIHSTISPLLCADLAAFAAERGVAVVDAPVSVRPDGKLLVMVGGDQAAVEQCRPVLESFGEPVLHLGPIGSGQHAKLVNNVLLAARLALAEDALTVGATLGLDTDQLGTALHYGSSTTVSTVQMLQRLVALTAEERASGAQTWKWATKDVGLMEAELARLQLPADGPLLTVGRLGARLTETGR